MRRGWFRQLFQPGGLKPRSTQRRSAESLIHLQTDFDELNNRLCKSCRSLMFCFNFSPNKAPKEEVHIAD